MLSLGREKGILRIMTNLEILKLDLFYKGASISFETKTHIMDHFGISKVTLADYASTSGISIILPGNIYVNVPIMEYNSNFIKETPYTICHGSNGFFINDGVNSISIQIISIPKFADHISKTGIPYSSYGVTHTDRIRVSPIQGCSCNCKFCDLHSKFMYHKKDIPGLIETIHVALNDPLLPAKHVLISGGTPNKGDYDYLHDVYFAILKNFHHVGVDIMMTPLNGELRVEELVDAGVNELSINLEIFDQVLAEQLMPTKGTISRFEYLSFIEKSVRVIGHGKVRSMLMVGLEPIEKTLAGVNALINVGCEPVLSPFRPDPSTQLRDMKPADLNTMKIVYEESLKLAESFGVSLGPKCIPCQHNTITFPKNR